jgi:hypothetical protein
MRELGYHIRIRLKDHRNIATSPEERRIVARVVLRLGKQANLLTFSVPANHLHAHALCDRAAAGQLSRRIGASLKQRLLLPVGFVHYEPKPITDPFHLGNTALYILGQTRRHGVHSDPFCEASNLPDLLGLRLVGRHTIPLLKECLPRLGRRPLVDCLGVDELYPMEGPPEDLLQAALRAACIPDLEQRTNQALEARRAVARLAGHRISLTELGQLLGVCPVTACRLRSAPADPNLLRAIGLQLGLQAQLGPRASVAQPYL